MGVSGRVTTYPRNTAKQSVMTPFLSVILGGSWDLVSEVVSILSRVRSMVTLFITLVTKSHEPGSNPQNSNLGA